MKWIVVREVDREVRDPANLYIYDMELHEVVDVFYDAGFTYAVFEHVALLDGAESDVSLVKPIFDHFVRLHTRLWNRGVIVGNAHIDVTALRPGVVPVGHVSLHNEGVGAVAALLTSAGLTVRMEAVEGYVVVKAYK
ncbi:MAG: hypothetical protein ABWK05_02725 [Pyrobaculum sp.]